MKTTYTYKTVGNLAIHADVHRLTGDDIRPAILWLHGGALIMGHREGIDAHQLEKYLNAGYAIISIDYRLAPQVMLPQIIEDLKDAWQWVRTKGPASFHIDPERIAVIGHSAGGYLALMAGWALAPHPRAIVSFYGYGDIAGAWYSQPDPFYNLQRAIPQAEAYAAVGTEVISEDRNNERWRYYLYTRQHGIWPDVLTSHDPHQEPAAFDAFCPLRNVSPAYPPTLLLHGDQDTDVPYEQSELMAAELARYGVSHEFVTMPGRGHGFDGEMTDPVVEVSFERVLGFLVKHL